MSKPRIAILDYGMGNIRSVANAVDKVEGVESLVSEPEQLADFDKLILPGVGAFAQAIQRLNESGLDAALDEYRASGKPILGICLGMQLLCSSSQEDGMHQGLNWFDARVEAIPKTADLVIPHMGWNNVSFQREDPILRGVESGSDFYFVHSYCVHCADPEDRLGVSEYGVGFASIIQRDNVYGMQFHPEKSQHVGLTLLKNFSLA